MGTDPWISLAPVPLGVSVHDVTISAIHVVAIIFGVVWTVLNIYNFSPVAQACVENTAARLRRSAPTEADAPFDESDMPMIDVLLPAYKEADIIEQSIRSIRQADYPNERLQLYVLTEPDDEATRAALADIAGEYAFTELTVPADYPGEPNKPRALNYGFEHSDGEVVGVIDAEDIVDAGLFKEIAGTIEPSRCYAVQGRLDMVNEDDGWLNTLFRAEYGFWYEIIMPAFCQVGYPVPLSGTTCFVRRPLLTAIGVERNDRYGDSWDRRDRRWGIEHGVFGRKPWDPENVTEDFELGLFLWQEDYDVGYLDSRTAEESPLTLDGWIKQRTRWKKGKLYTFFQYLHTPPQGARAKAHLFWQSMLPHVGPINLMGVILLFMIANLAAYNPWSLVGVILSLGLAFVCIVTGLFSYGYWRASDKPLSTRARRTVIVALTLPFYWLLQWGADLRALSQTYSGRFHWEPTEHNGHNGDLVDRAQSPSSVSERQTRKPTLSSRERLVALAAVVLVGIGARVPGLGGWSLWSDEIYSIAGRASLPLDELLWTPVDPHPPLYYLLLRSWMELFGHTAVSARALSVFLAGGAIVAIFLLGRELFDDGTGVLGALLFATSTFHVHYGRTARMYSLFALLTLGSWYGFVRLRTGSGLSAAGYVVASVALVYTHVMALFVIVAQYAYIVLSETGGGIEPRRWASVQVALGALTTPWLGVLAKRVIGIAFEQRGATLAWIPQPSTVALVETTLEYIGYPSHYPILGGTVATWTIAAMLLFVYAGTLGLSLLTYHPEEGYQLTASGATGQLALLATIPVVLPFVLSHMVIPIYAPRYTLPASLAVYLLVAKGLTNCPSRRARWALIGVLVVSSLVLVGAYHTTATVEDWQGVTDRIEREAEPGDLVLFQPGWVQRNVEYYYDGVGVVKRSVPTRKAIDGVDRRRLRRIASRHDRIWLVRYRAADDGQVLETLRGSHEQVLVERSGVITIYRFERGERGATKEYLRSKPL